jgi:hypothetical protein
MAWPEGSELSDEMILTGAPYFAFGARDHPMFRQFVKFFRSRRPFLIPFSWILFALPIISCDEEMSPEPLRHPLVFESLMAPSGIAPDTPANALVSFRIGSSSCWEVETVQVTVIEKTVRIEGNAINHNKPDRVCLLALGYGHQEVTLPALDEGQYEVIAGDLRTTLTVSNDSTSRVENVVYRGRLFSQDSGCAWGGHGELHWLFTGLPPNLSFDEYLVQGEVTSEDPCGEAPDFFERIVEVRSVVQSELVE